MSITLIDTHQSVSYNPDIICGDCGNFAKLHSPKAHKYVCNRDRYEVGDTRAIRVSDSDDFDTLQGMDVNDLNHYGPDPWLNLDRWETNPEIPDGYDGRYDDLDPSEQTVTYDQYKKGIRPKSTIIPTTSAYVEGQSGYLIAEAYNPVLTERYAFKVLNAYRDKTGTQRVGSIALTTNTDQTITAHCVKCNSVMTIDLLIAEREDMMEFTMSVIRHGNNHAAAWLRNRSDWYKIHEPHCDLNTCDPNEAGCNNTVSEAALIQLAEHFNERVA